MPRLVAFLRAVNVGGHSPLKMADLREQFETLQFRNVSTYKASGNIIFDADSGDSLNEVRRRIERELKNVKAVVRTLLQLKALLKLKPFGRFEVSATTRNWTTVKEIATGS